MARKNPERRDDLIAAAQQLFFTQGYENTSINDIINAVGVSKGAFYHYFASKQDILEAMVDAVTAQLLINLQAIIADETLSAFPKWQKVIQTSNDWKLERKEEMIEVSRLRRNDGNVLLQHKLWTERRKVMTGEMSKVIVQGVAESVFDVEFIPETTEIMMNILGSLSDTMNELLFNPDQYDDLTTLALRKNTAVQTAVERLLGVPAGSMPIIDEDTLIAWFTD